MLRVHGHAELSAHGQLCGDLASFALQPVMLSSQINTHMLVHTMLQPAAQHVTALLATPLGNSGMCMPSSHTSCRMSVCIHWQRCFCRPSCIAGPSQRQFCRYQIGSEGPAAGTGELQGALQKVNADLEEANRELHDLREVCSVLVWRNQLCSADGMYSVA